MLYSYNGIEVFHVFKKKGFKFTDANCEMLTLYEVVCVFGVLSKQFSGKCFILFLLMVQFGLVSFLSGIACTIVNKIKQRAFNLMPDFYRTIYQVI